MPVQNRMTRLMQTTCALALAVAMSIAMFAVVAVIPLQAAAGVGQYQVVDGAGNVVTLDGIPERIVSASVAGTEILFSLVDPERIIAVTTFDTDDYMSNVADRAKAAKNIIEFNAESVLVLDPDLVVVASWNNPDVVNQLKKAGIPVYVMADITAIEQIPGNIVSLGDAVGAGETARQLAAAMESRLTELDAIAAKAQWKPKVLIYTTWGSTYGRGTTYDELVRRCNALNVADELGIVGWGNVSEENIITTNPDFVLFDFYGPPDQAVIDEFKANPKFKDVSAVVNDRVLPVEQKHTTSTSQYVVHGFEDLLRVFHPELFL